MLHDGLEKRGFGRFAKKAARFIPNPYYQAGRFAYQNRKKIIRLAKNHPFTRMVTNLRESGDPTFYQFLNEEGLSEMEEDEQLAGRFGSWIAKTGKKIGQGAVKLQGKLAPIISVLPGGDVVNSAFSMIQRPKDSQGLPAPEPVTIPIPQQAAPAPAPVFMPQPAPAYEPPPQYYGSAPAPAQGGMIFGIPTEKALLYAGGAFLAYKLISNQNRPVYGRA